MGACGNGEGGRGLPLNPPFSSLFACPRVAHPPAHPPGPPGSGKPSGVVMGGGGGDTAPGGVWQQGAFGRGGISVRDAGVWVLPEWGGSFPRGDPCAGALGTGKDGFAAC